MCIGRLFSECSEAVESCFERRYCALLVPTAAGRRLQGSYGYVSALPWSTPPPQVGCCKENTTRRCTATAEHVAHARWALCNMLRQARGLCTSFEQPTLPPFFMPMTDVDSAGGGLGPPAPVKLPPAMPASALRALLSPTVRPAVKEYGCKHAHRITVVDSLVSHQC